MDISISLSNNKIEIENKGKFVAAKQLSPKLAVIFAATYRPPMSDETYMDCVKNALLTSCHMFSKMPIWIGGYIDLPDIEWSTDHQPLHTHDQLLFFNASTNTGLQQIVNFSTRNNNTLDVVLTNRQSSSEQLV